MEDVETASGAMDDSDTATNAAADAIMACDDSDVVMYLAGMKTELPISF